MEKKYDLEERLLDTATDTIRAVEKLNKTYAAQHVAKQLIRSATAPMALHAEARAAESKNDFVHKMKIAHKELRESFRWLKLIVRVSLLKDAAPITPLIDETDQLIRIFHASIKTAKSRQDRPE